MRGYDEDRVPYAVNEPSDCIGCGEPLGYGEHDYCKKCVVNFEILRVYEEG
jgi:hypothetical protein